MNIAARVGRLESATDSDLRIRQIAATDENDFREKFEAVLLSNKPGPAILDIDIAGVRSRERYQFRTHEEWIELVRQSRVQDEPLPVERQSDG